MADSAHTRQGKVDLKVPVRIPSECSDSIAPLYPSGIQRSRKLLAPTPHLVPGGAVYWPLQCATNDLLLPVYTTSVLNERRDEERHVHHLSTHHLSPDSGLFKEWESFITVV